MGLTPGGFFQYLKDRLIVLWFATSACVAGGTRITACLSRPMSAGIPWGEAYASDADCLASEPGFHQPLIDL